MPLSWRTQINQTQLVSQITTILLQRHNWAPLLQTLDLSSKLTPLLFHQIITKTQTNPKISLSFYNWAKSNIRLQPDFKSHCKLIRISIQSNLPQQAKLILDTLIKTQPEPTKLVSSIIQTKGSDSPSPILSFVIEYYSYKGLCFEGLSIFNEIRVHSFVPTVSSCNALLNALNKKDETKLAWCFYGAMIRDGVSVDRFTWTIVARILSKDRKLGALNRLLDIGIVNSVIYNLVIDDYCSRGDFRAAFDQLSKMCGRKLNPGFSTYSSILDGACRYGDTEVIERVVASMVNKKFLPESYASEHDSIIQKFSELGKVYAVEMFLKRACDEMVQLQDATYGCVLRVLSKEGRVEGAIGIYRSLSEKGITVNDRSYHAFANALCEEDPSEEVSDLLRDMISRGFSPHASSLSKFISFQCDNRKWREAEDLLNAMIEKGILPNLVCCCSLVKHYCNSRRIDSAIALHEKMEKLKGSLDATTYNLLISALFVAGRVEEAIRVFNYMKIHNLVSSGSFSAMIRGLCRLKELRKAMKLHDEMLSLGLKPDKRTYKRLISGFR